MNYLPLINNYGNKLPDHLKPIAHDLFKNLVKKGWTYEQIYWGIRLLKGRSIDQYGGLFYYKDFIDEINNKVQDAQAMINVDIDFKIKELDCLVGFGLNSVPEEYIDDLLLLDSKLYNSEYEYSQEELRDEINYLYEKCYLIPLFEVPLEEIERDEFLHRKYLQSRAGRFRDDLF